MPRRVPRRGRPPGAEGLPLPTELRYTNASCPLRCSAIPRPRAKLCAPSRCASRDRRRASSASSSGSTETWHKFASRIPVGPASPTSSGSTPASRPSSPPTEPAAYHELNFVAVGRVGGVRVRARTARLTARRRGARAADRRAHRRPTISSSTPSSRSTRLSPGYAARAAAARARRRSSRQTDGTLLVLGAPPSGRAARLPSRRRPGRCGWSRPGARVVGVEPMQLRHRSPARRAGAAPAARRPPRGAARASGVGDARPRRTRSTRSRARRPRG